MVGYSWGTYSCWFLGTEKRYGLLEGRKFAGLVGLSFLGAENDTDY